jgi:hypothetical protein
VLDPDKITAGCRRRVRPAVCDSANPSHQFLRPRHTTTTTDHYMQKNPLTEQYPSSPAPQNCQKRHGHIFHQGRRDSSQEGQREGQELDNRMCCHHVKSEPRTQTFTLHTRPSSLCAEEYVKLQSRWSCDEPEKMLLSVDTFLVCARKFICSLAFLFIFVFI